MSGQNTGKGDPKNYPALSQMNMADLKRLLAQELDSLDDAAPDISFIEAITEVIKERQAGTPEDADPAEAWRKLQNRLAEDDAAPETGIDIPPEGKAERSNAGKGSRLLRILRSAAVIALIFLAACGTASAFGINMFQAVAQWTTDTFRFVAGNHSSPVQADPYAELRAAVAEITDVAVVPNWAPDGTKPKEDIRMDEFSDRIRIQGVYESTTSGNFSIRILLYCEPPVDFNNLYQKDGAEVSTLEAGGITHYIMHNNGNCGAIWINGLAEVALQGDLSESDIEKMIISIYKGANQDEK